MLNRFNETTPLLRHYRVTVNHSERGKLYVKATTDDRLRKVLDEIDEDSGVLDYSIEPVYIRFNEAHAINPWPPVKES